MINSLYPPIRFGGAEQSVALLAEALARAGDEIHVATLHRESVETVAVQEGVTVHRLPLDNLYWAWPVGRRPVWQKLRWHARERWNGLAAARVERLIERVQPDVVHGQLLTGFGPALWPMIAARGLPLVQTIRDYSLICARAALFRRGRVCVRRCPGCRVLTSPSARDSRRVDALIGNSDFLIDAHRRAGRFAGVSSQRVFNIVPVDAGDPGPAHNGPLRFGFLGRIEPEKGIEVLLEALPRIGRADWRLSIGGVGEPDYVADLRRRHRDRRIEWLGRVDAGDFIRSIDVMIVPSLWPEPLPRTMIEGIAFGRSIIAARSGGIGEAAGFAPRIALYRADDPDALAQAMRGAIDHPGAWRPPGTRPPALAEEFSVAAAVAAHHAVYRRLLDRS